MDRPLPDDVARPARAYLAALLPASEVSDAWHELVADVEYWGDRDLLAVLRLAHQVVLQHERVSPEAATLVLAEHGVDRDEDVAVVLDADVESARGWARAAVATRDGASPDAAPRRFGGTSTATEPAPVPDEPEPASHVAPEPVAVSQPELPHDDEPALEDEATTEALRIGFDDDEPLPDLDGPRGDSRGRALAMLVLAVVLVAILWALAR